MLEKFHHCKTIADVIAVPFDTLLSTAVSFPEWKRLAQTITDLQQNHPDLSGVVILHGTSSMEETAYALSLTLKTDLPVVLTGSQRPASAMSSDAGFNIFNAVRIASTPEAREMGVMIALNDEIHAAREVTKSSNGRLQTFVSHDFGVLGHADGDRIVFYRKPARRHNPDTEFDILKMSAFPRVDIAYSYAGDDGTAINAFVQAGAKGIVAAAFAPGLLTPQEDIAMRAAVKAGARVVISSRAGSGRTFAPTKSKEAGYLQADNLNPQKARVLLGLALAVTQDPKHLQRIFDQY
jgi:L-asparaginase